MRRSAQRSTKIETLEKMLLMSASPLDGAVEADWVDAPGSDSFAGDDGNEFVDPQQEEFPDPFADDFAGAIPEATTESLSSNDDFLERVIVLTNEIRSEHGLAHVTFNAVLQATAQLQSANMAEQDFFSHQGLDGLMAWDRAANEGYNYQTIGENIAAGQLTPDEVVQGWANSAGHLENILNPNFTEIGVGYQHLQNDTGLINYHHYWTQVFGTEVPSEADERVVENSETEQPAEETVPYADAESTSVDAQPLTVDAVTPADETDSNANEPEQVKPPAVPVQQEPILVENEGPSVEVEVPDESPATEQPTTPTVIPDNAETAPTDASVEPPVTDQTSQDNHGTPPAPPTDVESNHDGGTPATSEQHLPETKTERVPEPARELIVPPAYVQPAAPTVEASKDEGPSTKSDAPVDPRAPNTDAATPNQDKLGKAESAAENKAHATTTNPTTSEEQKAEPKQVPEGNAINAHPKRTEDAVPDAARHIPKENSPATQLPQERKIQTDRPAAVQSPLADIATVEFVNQKRFDSLRGPRTGSPTDHSLFSGTTDASWKSEGGLGRSLSDRWTDRENNDDDDHVVKLTDGVDLLADITL